MQSRMWMGKQRRVVAGTVIASDALEEREREKALIIVV
jgi:hypothetical protein